MTSGFLLRSASLKRVKSCRVQEEKKVIPDKMKKVLIYIVFFLTLLGTSLASGNNNNEGVNAEALFYRRVIVDEDFGNKNATIEIHLTSIDTLVSVRVDTNNKINSITTTYLPGQTAQKETEPAKAKEKTATNQPQNTPTTNTSLPRPKTAPAKQQIIQRESAVNSSTWLEKAWNGFSCAVQSIVKWLYFGIEWPKSINSDKFARRTVTRSDYTCPADGSVNHSMFNLDITDMEQKTCPVTSSIHLMTLTDSNPWSQKSQNVTSEDSTEDTTTVSASPLERETDGSVSRDAQNAVTDVKKNEPSKRKEPIVVFMGHYDSEHEWPELLPEFTTFDYYGSHPEILSASPLQQENDDSMSPGSVDTDSLQEEDDYIYWPESPPEFATVSYYGMVPRAPVSENHEHTYSIESNGNPSVLRTSSIEENHESWPLKNTEIESLVLLDERNTSSHVDKESLPDPVDVQNHTTEHLENADKYNEGVKMSAVTAEISYNDTISNEDLMCPNHRVTAGSRTREDDNGVCIRDHEILHLSISDLTPLISCAHDDTPLQTTPAKKGNDNWMTKMVINESTFCLAGSNNKSSPETKYCSKNAQRRSQEPTWFTTKIWKRCMAIYGWRMSRGVQLQTTGVKKTQGKWMSQVPINVFEICMAGSNKSGPYSLVQKSAKYWLLRAQSELMRRIRGVRRLAGEPQETEFCTKKAAKRLADSQWFTAKLWKKGVAGVRWLKSNETQEKAHNLTNFYWTRFQITMINWAWQDTFDVMITIWMTDYCFMVLFLTIQYLRTLIKQLILSWRLQREFRKRELEEERERLRQLELKCERAAQPKPWRPKQSKKRRPNYCGRLQKW